MNPLYTLCAPNGVHTNTLQTNTAWVLHITYNLCCTCTKGFTHHFGFLFIYFQAFTLSHSFHFLNFSFNSSSHFHASTRSSAYSISHGRPSLTLCVTASITTMKSSELSTEPWCTPTFTQNHSLTDPPCGLTLVLACLYMAITALTNHSSIPSFLVAHSTTFLGTLSKAFSRSTNAHHSFLCFPLYLSCNCPTSRCRSSKVWQPPCPEQLLQSSKQKVTF